MIGVPAQASPEHIRYTHQVAREAGFGNVECVPEPVGALAFHLNSGEITPEEARQGVVVVDFGGGTLDVALLDQHGGNRTWGDTRLGGRLFDDLFLQWMLEQNPGLSLSERDWVYAWMISCRNLKERFSARWAQGLTNSFQMAVLLGGDQAATFRQGSVAEFERRARCYQPSPFLQHHLRTLQPGGPWSPATGPVDLFRWIHDTISRQGRGQRFSRVILSGGSSRWPFLKNLTADALGVSADRVLMAREPERSIGAGLALFNVLKRRSERTRHVLRGCKAERLTRFTGEVERVLDTFWDVVPRSVLSPLMEQIQGVFLNWYEQGGSLQTVEQQVQDASAAHEARLEESLRKHAENLAKRLLELTREHLQGWLQEHGIRRGVNQFVPIDLHQARSPAGLGEGVAGGLVEPIAFRLAGVLTAITTGLVVAIKLVVLSIAWPLLLTPVGVVAGVAGLALGSGRVQSLVREHHWDGWSLQALRWILSRERLLGMLQENHEQVCGQLREKLDGPLGDLRGQALARFEEVLDSVINDLGLLEDIRRQG